VEAIEQRELVRFGDFVGNPDVFALEVRGDSMIGDHICSGDMARLQPANSSLRPISVAMKDLEIQGRLLAVLRKYK
jgi:repressor LexA